MIPFVKKTTAEDDAARFFELFREAATDQADFDHFENLYKRGSLAAGTLEIMSHWLEWEKIRKNKKTYLRSKRILDFFASFFLMALASPLFLLVALAIAITSPGKIIFRQRRVGFFGSSFLIYKFRTMKLNPSGTLPASDTHYELTFLGQWLRKYKIDELPQLFNILKGEMSLVGPRPLRLSDTALVSKDDFKRFAMRPGMTGLWQSTYQNIIPIERKIHLDAQYVVDSGFLSDLKIIFLTIPIVVSGEKKKSQAQIYSDK